MGFSEYEIKFTPIAIQHLEFWQRSGQKGLLKKIEQLVESIRYNPTTGIGKPELLKHDLAGKYSRRINHEHRIITELMMMESFTSYLLKDTMTK